MNKYSIILMTILLSSTIVFGQEKLLTVAEKSDYKSTANYEDVKKFIEQLKKSSKI